MKTLNQIREEIASYEETLGFNPLNYEQQSPQWFTMKLGVMSASNAKAILAGSKTATKRTYIASLVSQIVTGEIMEINSKYLDWGNQHEEAARASYQFESGKKCVEVPLLYRDKAMRVAASPDFLVFNDKEVLEKGGEIKCPYNPENFVKFVCDSTVRKEHEKQVQFTMFVTGLETYDYGNYDPRAKARPLHWYEFERDDKMMSLFEEATQEIAHEMDNMLSVFEMKFGDQWKLETYGAQAS